MKHIYTIFCCFFLVLFSLLGIIFQEIYICLFLAILFLFGVYFFYKKQHFLDFFSILLPLMILSLTPISTELSLESFIGMGTMMFPALCLFYVTHLLFSKKQPIVRNFSFFSWTKTHTKYLIFVVSIVSCIMPFYLYQGSYKNWVVSSNVNTIFLLGIGLILVGIWDEMFFVNSLLSILKGRVGFLLANVTQAAIFTIFLFRVGFDSWGPIFIFPYTFLQGYMFHKTKSLLYIIIIHLIMDIVVFFSLLWCYKIL